MGCRDGGRGCTGLRTLGALTVLAGVGLGAVHECYRQREVMESVEMELALKVTTTCKDIKGDVKMKWRKYTRHKDISTTQFDFIKFVTGNF